MVQRDDAAQRFTYEEDGAVAELTFRKGDDRIWLVHTGVPDAMEGKGVGSRLVQAAIAYARDEDLTVVAQCAFVRSWLERHPEAAATITLA